MPQALCHVVLQSGVGEEAAYMTTVDLVYGLAQCMLIHSSVVLRLPQCHSLRL